MSEEIRPIPRVPTVQEIKELNKKWNKKKREWQKVATKLFALVLIRDKQCCQICKKFIESYYDMSLDHIVARSLGGSSDLSNLQLAHKKCNSRKGRAEQKELRMLRTAQKS